MTSIEQALIRAAKAYEAIPDWHHRALLALAATMFWMEVREDHV